MSNRVNVFAVHYFLWFAAISSIYGYINVYSKHYANSTSSQYGVLNMVLPFLTIGSKLVFCSLADRHRAYRTFFIVFLISALIGYGSFAVLPYLVTRPAEDAGLNRGTFAVICLMTSVATISMSVISCLSDAFAMNSSKRYNISYGFIRLWGTIGWGISSFLLAFINQYEKMHFLVPGLIMTIILIAIDVAVVSLWKNKDDFKLDKSASDVSSENVITVLAREPTVGNQTDQVVFTNDGIRLSLVEAKSTSAQIKYGSTKIKNDNKARASNKSKDIRSTGESQEMIDISSVKMQWILFKHVARRRRSIFRYMTLFTISGALISLQWSYFFDYLKRIYNTDFTFISGLSMVGQSMLGELPFFVLSQYFIRLLGRSHSISISIASIGFRYLLYEYLLPNSSMYFVLLTETFQGPNFGLFYVVMTDVGLDYSDCEEAIVSVVANGLVANDVQQIDKLRRALRATMQSIMSACYEGLGGGIGSIVGGLVIDYCGFSNLWFYSSLLAIFLGLSNMVIDVLDIPLLVDKVPLVLLKT